MARGFLHNFEVNSGLDQPGAESMAVIVPTVVLDASFVERGLPPLFVVRFGEDHILGGLVRLINGPITAFEIELA